RPPPAPPRSLARRRPPHADRVHHARHRPRGGARVARGVRGPRGARAGMTVVVLSTGGTIMARADPETGKLVPAVGADELVEMMAWPEAPQLEVEDFTSIPSWEIHGERALALARRAREHAARHEVEGVVVPHGT